MVENWRQHASCAEGDDASYDRWHSDYDPMIEATQRICRRCPVISECLEFALSFPATDDQWGVFGGLTPEERGDERIRRERAPKRRALGLTA